MTTTAPAMCATGARMKIKLIYCWVDCKTGASPSNAPEFELDQSAKVKDLDAELKRHWPAEGYEQFVDCEEIRLICGGKQYSTNAE